MHEDTDKVIQVKPDFEIILTRSDYLVRSFLDPFVETVGDGFSAGLAFRITRESVQHGVHAGLNTEEMAKILTAWSESAVPKNVVRALKDWQKSITRIKLSEAILVECPDPISAAAIHTEFPKLFEKIGAVVLKYTGKQKKTTLMKKLQKAGYFT